METRASYIVVGLFVVLGLIGMLVAAVWITGHRADQETARYAIYFDGNVAGLRPGNAVQYRGIPVGTLAIGKAVRLGISDLRNLSICKHGFAVNIHNQ